MWATPCSARPRGRTRVERHGAVEPGAGLVHLSVAPEQACHSGHDVRVVVALFERVHCKWGGVGVGGEVERRPSMLRLLHAEACGRPGCTTALPDGGALPSCQQPTSSGAASPCPPDLLLRCGRGAMLMLSAHSTPLSGQSCGQEADSAGAGRMHKGETQQGGEGWQGWVGGSGRGCEAAHRPAGMAGTARRGRALAAPAAPLP